jgi:hypothetical protein
VQIRIDCVGYPFPILLVRYICEKRRELSRDLRRGRAAQNQASIRRKASPALADGLLSPAGMGEVPARTVGRRNQGCLQKLGTAILAAISTLGCGSGAVGSVATPAPPPTISVSVTSASSSVFLGASVTLTPSVTGTTNTAVTWSVNQVTGGNATVGTITAAGIYTAPGILPQPASATITATSVADTSASASVTLTIASGFTVAVSGPASVNSAAPATFQATFAPAAGSNPNFGVTWSVTGPGCTGAACGLIAGNNSGSAESPEATYIAPTIAPSPNSVVVMATPVADPNKAASAIVTINPIVQVGISPQSVSVPLGGTTPFQASVTGSADTGVTWDVNGVIGGNSTVGTITPSISIPGQASYTAPLSVPPGGSSVAVDARSDAESSALATATVTLTSSSSTTPAAITTLAPSSATAGAAGGITLLVTGANFVPSSPGPGSTILIGGTARATACDTSSDCTTSLAAADLATAGQLSIEVQNPDLSVSSSVSFVIIAAPTTPAQIPLTAADPTAADENIVVADLSTAGSSAPATDVNLNIVAIGTFDTSTDTCTLGASSVPLVRPASGTATENICAFSVSGLDSSYAYTLSGPSPSDVTISPAGPLGLGIVQVTLLVPSTAVTGARTLFVQNPSLDITAATGALEVQ